MKARKKKGKKDRTGRQKIKTKRSRKWERLREMKEKEKGEKLITMREKRQRKEKERKKKTFNWDEITQNWKILRAKLKTRNTKTQNERRRDHKNSKSQSLISIWWSTFTRRIFNPSSLFIDCFYISSFFVVDLFLELAALRSMIFGIVAFRSLTLSEKKHKKK